MTKDELNQIISASLSHYPTVANRWHNGDPTVGAMLSAMRDMLVAVSDDVAQSVLEPFVKSKPKTIMADAINKGILPIASPCQHFVWIKNTGNFAVNLSAGRALQDNLGRQWRLLSSVNIPPQTTQKILCEQSFLVSNEFVVGVSLPFYEHAIQTENDSHIAMLTLVQSHTGQLVRYAPKLMNVGKGELCFSLSSTDFKTLNLVFGDDDRVGRMAQAGERYRLDVVYCDGFIDTNELKQAVLSELYDEPERSLSFYFFEPSRESAESGLVRQGANPPTLSHLRLLASYPMAYDDNAVFLGNFDMLLRKHFGERANYLAVWNEAVHERHYGASLDNINHLNVCVVAKTPADQASLEKQIAERIGLADNLFLGRVRFMTVSPKPYPIIIQGNLSGIHDLDEIKSKITGLLLTHYGKGSLIASRANPDGFNRQEMARLIYDNVPAFSDRISDFVVIGGNDRQKPHEWVYLDPASISIELNRSADGGTAMWGL